MGLTARATVRCAALMAAFTAALWGSVGHAQAYIRSLSPGTQLCVYWQNRHYVYRLDRAGYSQLDFPTLQGAVDASFQTWQSLATLCSGFQFSAGAPIDGPVVGYSNDGGTNDNILTFRETSCGSVALSDPCWNDQSCGNVYRCWDHKNDILALTTVTSDTASGAILDADVEFNASAAAAGVAPKTFSSVTSPPCGEGPSPAGGCVSTDLQNTLTHEIGHVVGLAHAPDPGSTMFKRASPGELSKRVIDNGTSTGFCGIYPAAGSSSSACDLTAQSHDAIGGTSAGTSFSGIGCSAGRGARGSSLFWSLMLLAGVALLLRRSRLLVFYFGVRGATLGKLTVPIATGDAKSGPGTG